MLDPLHEVVDVSVPNWQRRIPRQTEAAAAGTPARHLEQEHVAQLDVWTQDGRHRLEIDDVAGVEPGHGQGQIGVRRLDGVNRAVRRVAYVVLGRDVHAGQPGQLVDLLVARAAAEEDVLQAVHNWLHL